MKRIIKFLCTVLLLTSIFSVPAKANAWLVLEGISLGTQGLLKIKDKITDLNQDRKDKKKKKESQKIIIEINDEALKINPSYINTLSQEEKIRISKSYYKSAIKNFKKKNIIRGCTELYQVLILDKTMLSDKKLLKKIKKKVDKYDCTKYDFTTKKSNTDLKVANTNIGKTLCVSKSFNADYRFSNTSCKNDEREIQKGSDEYYEAQAFIEISNSTLIASKKLTSIKKINKKLKAPKSLLNPYNYGTDGTPENEWLNKFNKNNSNVVIWTGIRDSTGSNWSYSWRGRYNFDIAVKDAFSGCLEQKKSRGNIFQNKHLCVPLYIKYKGKDARDTTDKEKTDMMTKYYGKNKTLNFFKDQDNLWALNNNSTKTLVVKKETSKSQKKTKEVKSSNQDWRKEFELIQNKKEPSQTQIAKAEPTVKPKKKESKKITKKKSQSTDIVSQLKELKDLLDSGVLTNEEFEKAKKIVKVAKEEPSQTQKVVKKEKKKSKWITKKTTTKDKTIKSKTNKVLEQEKAKITTDKRDNDAPILIVDENITVNSSSYSFIVKAEDKGSEKIFIQVDGVTSEFKDGIFKIDRFSPVDEKIILVAIDQWGNKSNAKTVNIKVDIKDTIVAKKIEKLNPSKLKVKKSRNKVALIIGIEDYSQSPNATFANLDAKYFYEYASKGFGVKKENIKLMIDKEATLIKSIGVLSKWLPSRIKSGETDLIIFFAGHGLASNDGKDLFLLSQDSDPDLLARTALSRTELFKEIIKLNPKSVTMFLDTCYSGVSRDKKTLLASARPVRIIADEQEAPDNFTIFSASQLDQISSGLKDAKHGIFSYYLMKGLEGKADLDKDRNITNGELLAYMDENVAQKASELGRQQNPSLSGNENKILLKY